MFIYKRSLFNLARKSVPNTKSVFVRFSSSSSSSSCNDKLELAVDKEKAATKPTAKSGDPFKLVSNPKIPFMPVINIPETELAHNAFFSLHRPLLGLSDEEEKPFFSNKQPMTLEEQDQERLDDILANYMMELQPFVKPPPPGEEVEEKAQLDQDTRTSVSFQITESYQDMEELMAGEESMMQIQEADELESLSDQQSLPMFHMPQSEDVLDYLTTIEENMNMEHARLDAEDTAKALRLKKLEMLDSIKRNSHSRPRFYATNNRNIHQRLRRYQQKWNMKD